MDENHLDGQCRRDQAVRQEDSAGYSQLLERSARNKMSKSWEVKRLIVNTESSKVPHSVCCDGVEKYVLPDLSRAQAESIERMLNLIVASHATIS